MGRKIQEKDHNAAIFFRLRDEENWAIVDKLMTLPKYQKSRAKLINDAMSIGLPVLLERAFGEVTYLDEPEQVTVKEETTPKTEENISEAFDPRMKEIVSLLSEIVINTSLGKSMLCGLFKAKELEVQGKVVTPEKFIRVQLNDTPDCLFNQEIDMLKELSKKED